MVELYVKLKSDKTEKLSKNLFNYFNLILIKFSPYLGNYRWSETDYKGEASITISHKDLADLIKEDEKIAFEIVVKGETAATFRLLAYTSDFSNRALAFDCTETGYLKKDNLIQYQLLVNDLTS